MQTVHLQPLQTLQRHNMPPMATSGGRYGHIFPRRHGPQEPQVHQHTLHRQANRQVHRSSFCGLQWSSDIWREHRKRLQAAGKVHKRLR